MKVALLLMGLLLMGLLVIGCTSRTQQIQEAAEQIVSADPRFSRVTVFTQPIMGGTWLFANGSVAGRNDAFDLKVRLWAELERRGLRPDAITDHGLSTDDDREHGRWHTPDQAWDYEDEGGMA